MKDGLPFLAKITTVLLILGFIFVRTDDTLQTIPFLFSFRTRFFCWTVFGIVGLKKKTTLKNSQSFGNGCKYQSLQNLEILEQH